jgi:hypothetical protein
LQYRLASYLIEPSAHPFPEDTLAGLLLSPGGVSNQIRADAATGPRHPAGLGHRARGGATKLSPKFDPLAFCPDIATGSNQDTPRRCKLAAIRALSEPHLVTGTGGRPGLSLESDQMSVAPMSAFDRIVLVDPSNFTIPYDERVLRDSRWRCATSQSRKASRVATARFRRTTSRTSAGCPVISTSIL